MSKTLPPFNESYTNKKVSQNIIISFFVRVVNLYIDIRNNKK